MRTKGIRTRGFTEDGYISDFFDAKAATGFQCDEIGEVETRTISFTARDDSPHYKAGTRVEKKIKVTTCKKRSKTKAALVSDEKVNRKVIGVFCKFSTLAPITGLRISRVTKS